jgi:hypothetical protein
VREHGAMNVNRLLALGAALAISTTTIVLAADVVMPDATLTQAQHMYAVRTGSKTVVLHGQLESTDGCHKVRFERTSTPSLVLAQQYRYTDGMCTQMISWHNAFINVSAATPVVTVHTSTGVVQVKVATPR